MKDDNICAMSHIIAFYFYFKIWIKLTTDDFKIVLNDERKITKKFIITLYKVHFHES